MAGFIEEHPIWCGYWSVVLLVLGAVFYKARQGESYDALPLVVLAVAWPGVVALLILAFISRLFERRS